MNRIKNWIIAVLIGGIVLGFFYQTILFHKLPVPSDTLVGLYHPWRDAFSDQFPRGVPFKNFLITDPIRQQIPWKKLVVTDWLARNGGMWNPYTFFGVSLDANVQAAPFYPLNLLFFFFTFPAAWSVLIIIQPFLAALFLFAYLRHHRLSYAASVMGGVVWAFSGFSIAWLTWGTILQTALWLPLLLLCVDHIIEDGQLGRRSFRWGLRFLIAATLTLFAGHVQIASYVYLLTGVYILWHHPSKHAWKTIVPVVLAAMLITSVQWVPFIREVVDSGRSGAYDAWKTAGWFTPWQHLVQFFVPDFFGNPATLNYWGVWNYGELVGYIGIIPLILALSALALSGTPRFFAAVLLVSMLCMVPNPISRLPFLLHIPFLSVMQPTRLMSVVDFSLAILSAFGLEQIIHKRNVPTKSLLFVGLIFVLLWLGVLVAPRYIHDAALLQNLAVAKRNVVLPSAFFGVGMLILLFLRARIRLFKVTFLFALFVLVLIDLFRFGWKFTPFTDAGYFYPQTDVLSFLEHQKKPFRVMSMDDRILPPNTSGYYGIETIEGYDPIAPARYEYFLATSEAEKPVTSGKTGFNRIYTAHNINSPLLPYFNARYVLSLNDMTVPWLKEVYRSGDVRVYESTTAFPRAYLASEVMNDTSDSTTLETMLSSRERLGIFSGKEHLLQIPLLGDERAEITEYRPNSLTVRVTAINPRLLVILNRFDPRWHATIDGKAGMLYRTNYLFTGLVVPPGSHNVILSYY